MSFFTLQHINQGIFQMSNQNINRQIHFTIYLRKCNLTTISKIHFQKRSMEILFFLFFFGNRFKIDSFIENHIFHLLSTINLFLIFNVFLVFS
jgi:hypothetical protein